MLLYQAGPQQLRSASWPSLAGTSRKSAPSLSAPRLGDRAAEFPHRQRLESTFGAAVPGHAVVDSVVSRGLGVEAFTEDATTHFSARTPSMKVAAHEAAHQLQNAGRTQDVGLEPEAHAEVLAQSATAGRSARHLLGGSRYMPAPAVRPYTEIPVSAQKGDDSWATPSKLPLRLAADGNMAATQDGAYGTHELWAKPSLVNASNSALTARKSVIRLRTGGGWIGGVVPGAPASTLLLQVVPENVATSTAGNTMSLWADCGRSARDVMGAGGGTGKNYDQVTAMYSSSGAVVRTSAHNPEDMKNEIVKNELGGGASAAAGWTKYNALAPSDRAAFDKKTGINRYAAPGVGEGFTMSSGGASFPGKTTWNFHWAGVVMRSGGDVVTLENFAVGDPDAKNTDWNFQMYGPPSRLGQTFHEQHLASQQHGMQPTTMRVAPL
jgi:hypothetical protein